MPSLADRFCPQAHEAAITAASGDPYSETLASADETGVVAITRSGERTPGLVFQPGVGVTGALTVIQGGHYVAVGDDAGSVGVFKTDSGAQVFVETRQGRRGRVRAMRGLALSPEGRRLAAIAVDGLVRVWDLVRGEREVAWQGFGGKSVTFDARGERLLCIDAEGQVRLIDLRNREGLPMDRLQMPAERAWFTPDNTYIVCAGPSGISLLRVVDGVLCNSFATRGGSGIQNLVLSPDGRRVAAVTTRSVHLFDLPSLTPVGSSHHGAPNTSGAALWLPQGVIVGGSDGLLHDGRAGAGMPPVTAAAGTGPFRLAVHRDRVALWKGNDRVGVVKGGGTVNGALIDRDGRLIVLTQEDSPVTVYSALDGRRVFEAGPDTVGTSQVLLGGSVVALRLPNGGARWWDLASNLALELSWPTAVALSGSGTWMAVVTPRGAARILDPSTGHDALPVPVPLADVPIARLAFMNRQPGLLVLDQDGVLGHYDLSESARKGTPARGRDILTFNEPVDALWGPSLGQAVLRLPEGDRCTLLVVDIETAQVTAEITDLHPATSVDLETGTILEPVKAGALLERDLSGTEQRVLRSLSGKEWLSFEARGILGASDGAAGAIG